VAYLSQLEALAAELGSRCEFVGPVFDEDALIREYHAASIFVYPTRAARGEALPVAPLEAMAAGCAVIVSDLRCFDDYVAHGATGLAFDHRAADPHEALAAQVARLVTEPDLLERIADAGRRTARRFDAASIAGRMLDDFASVVGDPTPRTGIPARTIGCSGRSQHRSLCRADQQGSATPKSDAS